MKRVIGICHACSKEILVSQKYHTIAGPCSEVSPSTHQWILLVETLTPRERDVARLITYGYTNKEIGRELHISERTVQYFTSVVFSKLNLDRIEVAILMLRLNEVKAEDIWQEIDRRLG